ncbi:TPA: hypothetical protein N0F65_004510 [Lagenidium giganteum]|uniref:ABC1 atypical kinase-like domain-containing protein n=1 Tax=Lagenidium giganteum TaxID=4803 RepID=A0AAV2YVI9_9STRA|nr:TPA: hypothetical protein N0F65_004510 [Lagenidium giganteum]
MWSRDFLRVLHGAGKVAEQLAKTQVPPAAAKTGEYARHASEVLRSALPIMMDARGHAFAHEPTPNEQPIAPENVAPSAAAPATNTHANEHHVAPIVTAMAAEKAARTPVLAPKTVVEPVVPATPEVKKAPLVAPIIEQIDQAARKIAQDEARVAREATQAAEQPSASKPIEDFKPDHPAWKERHVPSSPLSRILGFGSLAAKLAVGTATEIVRSGGKSGTYNAFVSDANAEKLAETLCTMRGAALKLGQMLSIQDENLIPSKLAVALDRVRQNAHVMPKAQLHAQLASELGENWRDNFKEFDDVPIAAASIGQVHRATLQNGERVAIKIQYPGVAESIESDLLNLKRLVTYTNILPRGLYIDEIIRVGQEELTLECDYLLEAQNQDRFRRHIHESGMANEYSVPRVYHDLSTARVLTTELISGVAVDKVVNLPQEVRNSISRRILELTIRELFDWRFMQTDPNWSNFMYNSSTDMIGLIDFGAAREYNEDFVNEYFKIVWAAANEDEQTMMDYSLKMKFLTGDESQAMKRAHIAAGMVVGEPFRSSEPFDFHGSQLTKRLATYTETFMHGRLTPPPQEVYSLHRKLAGAFLMCIKLRAKISCRDVLEDVHAKYQKKQQ